MEVCDGLNMKATELRLGLPGREEVDDDNEKKKMDCVFVKKRGFPDSIKASASASSAAADALFLLPPPPTTPSMREKSVRGVSSCHGFSPSSKAQVVGWPPIRSFRKNAITSGTSKADEDAEVKSAPACLYVKVSMDGAPYLRKIDLKNFVCYIELSSALEKMFTCFSIGQCDGFSESRVMDLLHGSEYVLTYEDRDGDWMLVGDVPWDMFMESCRRLRIMLSSEAIGLAPRAFEKCRSRN